MEFHIQIQKNTTHTYKKKRRDKKTKIYIHNNLLKSITLQMHYSNNKNKNNKKQKVFLIIRRIENINLIVNKIGNYKNKNRQIANHTLIKK